MTTQIQAGLIAAIVALVAACAGEESDAGDRGGKTVVNGPTAGGTASSANVDPRTGAPGAPGADPNAPGGPGAVTAPRAPFEERSAVTSVRKVKNLLTGLAPTDSDLDNVRKNGAAGMQELIRTWTTDAATQPLFREKMIGFFRNAFQQTGFTPTEDFKPQLLENGGFDFGPFGTSAVGDDSFARLIRNIEDSFAVTAWQLVAEGRPLTEVLTTQRYMMTTGLKAVYLQIEMANDQPFNFSFNIGRNQMQAPPKLQWKLDYSGNAIPLEQTLDPNSPNYMVFDDQAPVTQSAFGGGFGGFQTCRGGTTMDMNGNPVVQAPMSGYAQLFQRLIGYSARYPFSANPTCWEHAAKPYFTADDMSDWKWVTLRTLKADEARLQPYDIPRLREATEIGLKLPRVGYYTTPAFLALWNTNDSNQHRVTANQTLLVAFGQSFSSDNAIIPLSAAGLDSAHSVSGSECMGCHQGLDPLRQFWANQFDFNDRNDFPTFSFMMTAANPRPTTSGGVLAFADLNQMGASIYDLGPMLARASDGAQQPLNQFGVEMTQKLCFYANSEACSTGDPEFRRVAKSFEDSNFSFLVLVKELFASPLVTGAAATMTFPLDASPVSIARRTHVCAALSNRLGKPDLCASAVPIPSPAQSATAKIASSIAADAFSRGSETPITSSVPTLFYRAATELLCENIANQVVDGMVEPVFTSANVPVAIDGMVEKVMGYPPSHPTHAAAAQLLQEHYDAARTGGGGSGRSFGAASATTSALRSTFALACQSPQALGIGL